MTILLPSSTSFPLAVRNSPVNLVNPPLWLPVTFEPTKLMAEFSGPNVKCFVFPSEGAAAVAVAALLVWLTVALATSSAGLEQPAKINALKGKILEISRFDIGFALFGSEMIRSWFGLSKLGCASFLAPSAVVFIQIF